MANFLGKAIGTITGAIVDIESGGVFTSPLNKLWRAKILLNRATSPMEKARSSDQDKANDLRNHHYTYSTSLEQKSNEWTRIKKYNTTEGGAREVIDSFATDYTKNNKKTSRSIQNDIIIINKNTTPPTKLVIQNRPNELSINPMGSWVSVKSMGRNNPFMIYTGGEDTISFDISWYVSDPNRRDEVLVKCRLLESWSRANGYKNAPPVLNILWGNSDIFSRDSFILESAPYKLTHFQNSMRSSRYNNDSYTGQRDSSTPMDVVDLKLYPNFATQTLTFKRVTPNNRTHLEIIPDELLKGIKGIEFDSNNK